MLVAGLLVLSVVGVALAASFSVDTFNTGTLSVTVNSGPTPPTHASGSEAAGPALGGFRKIVLDWISWR